jgi:rubrerythrin
MLLQKGADVLKQIDTLTLGSNGRGTIERQDEEQDTDQRIENVVAARRAHKKAGQPHKEVSDDEIESMIVTRRKARKEKSAGFCPKCGKPVMASDRFCPSCGKAL